MIEGVLITEPTKPKHETFSILTQNVCNWCGELVEGIILVSTATGHGWCSRSCLNQWKEWNEAQSRKRLI